MSDRSNFPPSSSKTRRRAIFPARRTAAAASSSSATPSSTHRPAPIEPPGVTDARVTRWTTARTTRLALLEIEDPRGVRLRPRFHRARQLVVAVCLARLPLMLERPAERVVRVVVGRREILDDRPKLPL